MTDPDAVKVEVALRALCRLAGAVPDDGSPPAARAVRAALERGGYAVRLDEATAPGGCPLARYLADATGLPGSALLGEPFFQVGTHRIVLLGERAGGARPARFVDLPPAVRTAVALIGVKGYAGLIRREAAA